MRTRVKAPPPAAVAAPLQLALLLHGGGSGQDAEAEGDHGAQAVLLAVQAVVRLVVVGQDGGGEVVDGHGDVQVALGLGLRRNRGGESQDAGERDGSGIGSQLGLWD